MVGFGIDGPPYRLNCASSTADDKDSLPFGVLAVKLGRVEDLSVEFLLVWQVRSLRVTTCSHSCNDTIEPAVAWSLTIQRPCLSFEIEVTRVSNYVRSSPYRLYPT
jgi:hypothetical protein